MAIKKLVTSAAYSSCWSLQGNSFSNLNSVFQVVWWICWSCVGRCYPLFLISQGQGRAWICTIQELQGRHGCNNLILAGEETEIIRRSNYIHLVSCYTRNVISFRCGMVTGSRTCAFLKSTKPLLLPDHDDGKGCLRHISCTTCWRRNLCLVSG